MCEQAEILEWLTGGDAVKGRPATAGTRPGTSGDRGATEVRPEANSVCGLELLMYAPLVTGERCVLKPLVYAPLVTKGPQWCVIELLVYAAIGKCKYMHLW